MTTKLNVALICSLVAGSASVAFAAANPSAAVLTVRCGIFDAVKKDGTPDLDARSDCNDVGHGDADHPAIVELYSGGMLIYTEINPPIENGHDGGTMRIQVTGNGTRFQPWYVNDGTSWVDMPNLQVQIWKLDIDKDGTTRQLVLKNVYLPSGSALWAIHSDDTRVLQAEINAEIAARIAGDAAEHAFTISRTPWPQTCPAGQIIVSNGAGWVCQAQGGGGSLPTCPAGDILVSTGSGYHCGSVCGGAITDLTTTSNCGSCGNVCAGGQTCTNAVCVGGACVPNGGNGASCAAQRVICPGAQYTDNNTNCTGVRNAPASCGANGQDLVYQIAPSAAARTITANTCTAGGDTVILATSGACGAAGAVAACNDDFCGLRSQITFAAAANTTYWLYVSGFAGGCGNYTLTVTGL